MDFFTKLQVILRRYLPDFFDRKKLARAGAIVLSFFVLFFFFAWSAPREFPEGRIFTVEKGSTVHGIALALKQDRVVRSAFWYEVFARVYDGDIGAGDYVLDRKQTVFGIVGRLAKSDYRLKPVKVTIPEGTSAVEMAALLQKQLQKFDTKAFLDLALLFEGYLFPDTYYFLPHNDPTEVVRTLTSTFSKRIVSIQADLSTFKKPIEDVVIMASILEEEGKTTRDREIIAGILWKRLSKGMPLQVDAPFRYSIGKDSYTLTTEDLRADGPYNTYTRKGLPPTAITNPGLDSLFAAVHPIVTPYYFFLSEKNGDTHYAITYEEHLVNKEKYMR